MSEQIRNRQERLMKEALDIINGSRQKAYGPPERNFGRIAVLWEAYLAAAYDLHRPLALTALDVCHMLDLVKLARLIATPDHEDSIRDRFGYQGCYVDLVYGKDWKEWPPSDGATGATGEKDAYYAYTPYSQFGSPEQKRPAAEDEDLTSYLIQSVAQ